ncbi:hypothetical protein A2662_04605 [Candidatus Giovannonibacteria bacterium RIFCSPHIGHO2_01_FULL_45_33]|uniref:Uncharacterized protein n=1 Tax=Candidatus Giovannonibacteria bacterium RIFCSPLOWO2_01_FULL_45_34 TaxID=1798351 RepID=A0A1F5WZI5_9BACT|nr:MAG: hypothetical protein A2662_04605 [Candidatus Giovannonibacteria bacterium RIFCSPHIGHO2_01_FULL_45_33]OGF69816.1 MAG: hypothetical protein A3C73_03520 [Candidatus Giovannonibacteria bacterium RIFCSPHIGHO2_02_FULL_44_11]OGF81058.1 MAG: hypothetical protein A2930_03320 [Candidatus Giovannonibacteria bacterium RIFCSPLOWO2_01_FULL_45_34]
MKTNKENLAARIRRRTQDKIFLHSMTVLSMAFIYCFGWRPLWLYGHEPTQLWNWRWQIDTVSHYLFGIGFCWILIYGDRLSTEPARKWTMNIIGKCALIGVFWEFAVEMPFDIWLRPWLENIFLPYLAETRQIYWPLPEMMQKGNIDTDMDLLVTVLGAISGLMLWKYVWKPIYALIHPSHAREEYYDELSELYDYSRKRTVAILKNFREARREEVHEKKDSKTDS